MTKEQCQGSYCTKTVDNQLTPARPVAVHDFTVTPSQLDFSMDIFTSDDSIRSVELYYYDAMNSHSHPIPQYISADTFMNLDRGSNIFVYPLSGFTKWRFCLLRNHSALGNVTYSIKVHIHLYNRMQGLFQKLYVYMLV